MSTNAGIARFGLVLGTLACVLPPLAKELDWTPHGPHSDLWFALGVFVVGWFLEFGGGGRARLGGRAVVGLLAIAIAGISIPDFLERMQSAGEPGVDGYLADAARQSLFAYVVVANAGLFLLVTALAALSREQGGEQVQPDSEVPRL